jgi:hypothetical protein
MSSKADADLIRLGSELADVVIGAIPGWITGAIESRVTQWEQIGRGRPAVEKSELAQMAQSAGEHAAVAVAAPLKELLAADVDQQWTTPLALVRPLVGFATGVLEKVGVPGVERDDFQVARFPDDEYGLTPASLSVLGEDVADLALVWGAAKALAHRQRHSS